MFRYLISTPVSLMSTPVSLMSTPVSLMSTPVSRMSTPVSRMSTFPTSIHNRKTHMGCVNGHKQAYDFKKSGICKNPDITLLIENGVMTVCGLNVAKSETPTLINWASKNCESIYTIEPTGEKIPVKYRCHHCVAYAPIP